MLTLLALAAMALPTILVVALLLVAALAGRPAHTVPAALRLQGIRGQPGAMHPAGTMGGARGRSGGTDSVSDPLALHTNSPIRMTTYERFIGWLSQTDHQLWPFARAEPRLT